MGPSDLSKCEVRTPTGAALVDLYEMLIEVFPVDRPVFTEMIEKDRRFYTWTPYALYEGERLLGNVALVPMRIWLEGEPAEVVGVASVATRSEYRRQGVARHLLRHAMGLVDERRLPAVLLTGMPRVYTGLGFQAVAQAYLAAPARSVDFASAGLECRLAERLQPSQLDEMAKLYAGGYPDYDGKVVRDPDYWQLYEMLFNPYPNVKLVFCVAPGGLAGYLRFEIEDDRLLISELCCRATLADAARALLGFAAGYARQSGRDLLTVALPSEHFAVQMLREAGVPLEPEPLGAHREAFMARPAQGEPLGRLGRIAWSLADKF